MANDDLPGFIDDEPKPAAKKAAAPPPAASPEAFNPFADTKVTLDPTAAPGSAAEPAAKSAPKPAASPGGKPGAKPGTGRTAKAAPPPVADFGDADVVPGAAKDLWLCPHCGAKNKPGRPTCRACGKAPSDEADDPWHAKPAARIGIAVAVLAIASILACLAFGGGDVQLAPADAAHVDRAPRTGRAANATIVLDDSRSFVAQKRFAVCGRVLIAQPGPLGTTQVALALADSARDDATFQSYLVDTSRGDIVVRPEPAMVMLYLLGDGAPRGAANGDWMSLIGDVGVVELAGQAVGEFADGRVVRVERALP